MIAVSIFVLEVTLSRRRPLVALLLVLSTLGFVAISTSSGSAGAASGAVPAAVASGGSEVRGVVVDQAGRDVDDVLVQAVSDSGTVAASSLTYASEQPDGPQHGYFSLQVRRGTYDVTLSKDGYVSQTLEGVSVARRSTVNLGEVALEKQPVSTGTRSRLKDAAITAGERAKLVVTVTTQGAEKAVGRVQVRAGGKIVGSGSLRGEVGGQLTLTLDRLAQGRYPVKAYFLGSQVLKSSGSEKATLTVKRASR